MKKLLFLLLPIGLLLLGTSCEKEDLNDATSFETIISKMESSTDKTLVDQTDLPEAILTDLSTADELEILDEAYKVHGLGYEVFLMDENVLYYKLDGNPVTDRDGNRVKKSRKHCGGKGTPIKLEDIDQSFLDYVADNYPDETVRYGKLKDDGTTLIFLSGRVYLVFDADGNFVEENECPKRVRGGHGNHPDTLSLDSIPALVLDYITDNYPDGTIEKAFQGRDNDIIIRMTNGDDCFVLIFDADGNFVAEKPCRSKGNGSHGGDLTAVDIADLPVVITDYISSEYPNATIKRAGTNADGMYFVKIRNGRKSRTLVFDADGSFIKIIR